MNKRRRKLKGKEARLGYRLILRLESLAQKYKLLIGKTKVLCDLTCVREKHNDEEKFQLVLGFAEVDIAIYKPIKINKEKIMKTGLLKLYQDEQDKNGNQDYLNIPLVILELKSGSVTSDSIRARSVVAEKIRDIFPFCAYFFIAENTTKRDITLYRQGKSFTKFYTSPIELQNADIEKIRIWFIEPHLNYLQEHFGKQIFQ
jgi:hypothetical protein